MCDEQRPNAAVRPGTENADNLEAYDAASARLPVEYLLHPCFRTAAISLPLFITYAPRYAILLPRDSLTAYLEYSLHVLPSTARRETLPHPQLQPPWLLA